MSNKHEKCFYDGYFGVWRTVGGRKIFIRDGEPLNIAMERSGKFKSTIKLKDNETEKFKQLIYSHDPKVSFDDDYVFKNHSEEKEISEWLKNTFNTEVHLISEKNNQYNVDALLNGKVYCEFKNASSNRSIEGQMRKTKIQLMSINYRKNPVSVLINITSDRSFDDVCKEVVKRHKEHFNFAVYCIVKIKNDYRILYLNK